MKYETQGSPYDELTYVDALTLKYQQDYFYLLPMVPKFIQIGLNALIDKLERLNLPKEVEQVIVKYMDLTIKEMELPLNNLNKYSQKDQELYEKIQGDKESLISNNYDILYKQLDTWSSAITKFINDIEKTEQDMFEIALKIPTVELFMDLITDITTQFILELYKEAYLPPQTALKIFQELYHSTFKDVYDLDLSDFDLPKEKQKEQDFFQEILISLIERISTKLTTEIEKKQQTTSTLDYILSWFTPNHYQGELNLPQQIKELDDVTDENEQPIADVRTRFEELIGDMKVLYSICKASDEQAVSSFDNLKISESSMFEGNNGNNVLPSVSHNNHI